MVPTVGGTRGLGPNLGPAGHVGDGVQVPWGSGLGPRPALPGLTRTRTHARTRVGKLRATTAS